jgi:MYXO-CTERM domain-containing protein
MARIPRTVFLGSVALLWSCTDPDAASTDSADTTAVARPLAVGLTTGDVALARSAACDNDGSFDDGETLQVKVPITNDTEAPIEAIKATITSKLAAAKVQKPETIEIKTLKPGEKTTLSYSIDLDDTLTAPTDGEFTIEITANDTVIGTIPVLSLLQADDKPQSSATDKFDASFPVWKASHDAQSATDEAELWTHVRKTGLEGAFVAADPGVPSDASLTSPVLTGTGNVTVSFIHTFEFQVGAGQADGGVIEVTTDGGVTWSDITTFGLDPYTATLEGTKNVLAGRRGFGGTGATNTVMLDFGNQLQGKMFQIRFRVASDASGGGAGWTIDEVAFTGIIGTPFSTVVADTGTCAGVDRPKVVDDGGGCQVGGAGGNLAGLLVVLGVVVLRRRRR